MLFYLYTCNFQCNVTQYCFYIQYNSFFLKINICSCVKISRLFHLGHCSMIGAQTGKVLDCEVRIKSCRICEHAKREKKQPKDHDCRQNWQGIVNCFTFIGLIIQLSICLSRVLPLITTLIWSRDIFDHLLSVACPYVSLSANFL